MLERLIISTRLGFTNTLVPREFNLSEVNFAELAYIGDENSTKARSFNLNEDLGLYKNVKSATRWSNSETSSHLDWLFANE